MTNDTLTLTAEIQQISYHAEESGYCILKVLIENQKKAATITGYAANPLPGQTIKATGTWITHTKFGKQFKAEAITQTSPKSKAALIKYLSSGILPGIGEKLASTLLATFDFDILDVI